MASDRNAPSTDSEEDRALQERIRQNSLDAILDDEARLDQEFWERQNFPEYYGHPAGAELMTSQQNWDSVLGMT
jgi:hypothetical protein